MIIRNMRWGYDGGGMACGPVGGTYIAEIMVTDSEGRNWFVSDRCFDSFETYAVYKMPILDIVLGSNMEYVDSDYEFEKIEDKAQEQYDLEDGEFTSEMIKSKFRGVFQLLKKTMNDLYSEDISETKTAEEYIEQYLDTDL